MQNQFIRPQRQGRPVAYFCGHSLGLQPLAAAQFVKNELDRWGELGVDGHFTGDDPWIGYHSSLAVPMAAIVGAEVHEVSILNTLSVNIHLMLASFYRPQGRRTKILMESPAFPSDQYAVESYLRVLGLEPDDHIIEIGHDAHTYVLDEDELCQTIEQHADELALVFLGGVQYISGQVLDMQRIAAKCRQLGIACGFDLAHAAGNADLNLNGWDVDFAVWCCYKYLNGGPGTLGGIFVHDRHLQGNPLPRLAGWWGYQKETRFKMAKGFIPESGADGWALSNPPILAMAPLKASLPMFVETGLTTLKARSKELTHRLEKILTTALLEIDIITPEKRGSMLSMRHPQARALFDYLQAQGIVCDWREPGLIRMAPCALYTTDEDLDRVEVAVTSFSH